MQIRGYRSDDLDALYAVSLATGDAGGDASALYRDPRLIGHVFFTKRRADVDPVGIQESVGHTATDDDLINFLRQMPEHRHLA